MVDEAGASGNCFAENLLSHRRRPGWLATRLVLELGFLIFIPLLIVLGPKIKHEMWAPPDNITAMTILKIISITIHGLHTAAFSPQIIHKITSILMFFIVFLLCMYLARGSQSQDYWVGQFFNSQAGFVIISLLPLTYMTWFLGNNLYLKHWRFKPNELGKRTFIDAFIFAVNIPFILGFISIICIYFFVLTGEARLFLSGATSFLVFISSASSVCVDYFGKMFLLGRPCVRPRPCPAEVIAGDGQPPSVSEPVATTASSDRARNATRKARG